MRRASASLAVLVLVLAGAACGDDDPVSTGGSTTTPGHPADVVLTITSGGGFVPFGTDFASVPLKVQRDGTVLTGGAVPTIYPGPALSPVMTGHITGEQVRALLEAAKDAGLDAEHLDAGQPGVTDMPSTTIRVEIDGTSHTHSVYALSFGGEPGGDNGLTADEQRVRAKVSDFVTEASDVVQRAADQPFVPTGYQVLASPADPAAEDGEVTPNELAWPFEDLVLVEGGCIDVDAAHAPALADALKTATQITIWRDAQAVTWHLFVRDTLPGDESCHAPQD